MTICYSAPCADASKAPTTSVILRRPRSCEALEGWRLGRDVSFYLYDSGSGESDGLANVFFSSAPIGVLRFNPFGGIFCMNHLS